MDSRDYVIQQLAVEIANLKIEKASLEYQLQEALKPKEEVVNNG